MESRLSARPLPPAEPYRPNAILRWLYRRFFAHITVDEGWSEAVRQHAQRGTVIYVMRSVSFLDFLCLDFLAKKLALPLIQFVNDLGLWILEPFGKGDRRLRLRRQIPEDQALGEVVKANQSALLFLRRPPKLGQDARKGRELETDLIRTLVETQRQVDRPILLLPQTFVWSKLPPKKKRSIWDLFFGPVDWPGRVRVFFQFLLNYRNALLRSGDAFDLRAFVEQNQDLTDREIADQVRYALLRRMERERTLVLGPSKKSPQRMRDELLRSPRVRKQIEAHARATQKPVRKAEREAARDLAALCAAPSPQVMGVLHRILDRVWNRIYDGLVVDLPGLERVREAARRGTLVLLPSHKSHIDYLVLSDVLYANALNPPLVAAGDNLGFWPLGPVLRRAGAFFIRRTFKGKKLYSALVDAYLRKLLLEGFSIEFFIEGGRSRTGKVLPPKMGLLSMVVDAALQLQGREVFFVPISINYERIVEERSYVHELEGGEKTKENVGGLLKTPRVLRSKYGRLYVHFGEILPFSELITKVDPTPAERRQAVQKLAHRAIYEINRATVLTPAALVATALLVNRRRGMPHGDLVESARMLLESLQRLGARVAGAVVDEAGELRTDAISESVALFADGKLVQMHGTGSEAIYQVPDERRLALEYYKNNVLHFFVPSALISAALLSSGGEPITEGALREKVRRISRLFKYEFMYRADTTFEQIFADAMKAMLEAGELEIFADHVRPADEEGRRHLVAYAELLRTYFESYRLAARATNMLLDAPLSRKEWLRRALALGQRMYLSGEIEQRESLSRPKLENALQSLRDHGIVRFAEYDTLEPGDDLKKLGTSRELEERLASYLK